MAEEALDIGGGGVATGEGEGDAGAGEGAPATGFDWAGTLPENLPDGLKQFKGKTFQDIANSAGSAQSKIGEQGTQISALTKANDELQAGLKQAQAQNAPADDPVAQAAAEEQRKQMMARYNEASQTYIQTGEIDEDVLAAVEGQGIRVGRDTLLEFMEFQKFRNDQMVAGLTAYAADPAITPEVTSDVMDWLKSGDSPFSLDERKGFDKMAAKENLGWFDTVMQEYNDAFGGEQAGDHRAANRKKTMKKTVRGRPVMTPTNKGFKDTRDFQEQLIAIRADQSKTTRQKQAAETDLIARRRAQRGE